SESNVVPSLMNGACTAMTFDFANRYLEMRKTHSPEEIIDRIGADYERTSQTLRTRQAAFNAIGKVPGQNPKDFSQAKINAMLRFHNRKIECASEAFNIREKNALAKIRKIMKNYQEGVFIIRSLWPANNDKGEVLGH